MRRQTVILTAFFALFLAVLSPIRAQEPASTDANAEIMLAASNLAYERISDLIRGRQDGYTLTSETSATNPAELYAYILKDVADDSTGDVWFFSGTLLTYGKKTSSNSASGWLEFPLTATLYRLGNGNWALCSSSAAFGLPNNMTSISNTYGVTYDEGATYYEQYVAAARRISELRGATFNETYYRNYINYATWDTDGGGVNNLAEWVRGTAIDDWTDDAPADNDCKCGACCSCECVCGRWSGDECGKTHDDCACHPKEPDCTCGDYCCACECMCEKCADGTHSAHQNGSDTCDGTSGDTIGFFGCDCHKTTEEPECECANYCCKHTCECLKCGDGEHSAHKNDNGECDGTFENCSDCHEEENPEEETCTCANYCCYHTCACPIHKDKEASEHSQHGNGATSCDGTTGNGGCACHETTGDEEECTCAKYCCYHACECKRCASLPAGSHSQHKNNSPTCDGTNGSGGCSCHETTDDGKFEAPGDQEFDVPEDKKNQKFLDAHEEFKPAITRLEKAFEDKYGVKNITKYFSDDFSGALPSWELELSDDWGVARVDFNELKKYDEQLTTVRAVLVALVYLLTAAYVLQTLRKLV